MKSISANVSFNPRASRLELLVRIVWAIVGGIVLAIFSFVSGIVWVIQVLYVLFLGRRHKGMQAFIKSVNIQHFRLSSYLLLLTDERPPIIPQMFPA